MKEIWKPVFQGVYEVSNFGRVRRWENGRVLKPDIAMGYEQVTLSFRACPRRRKVHALVAEAFIGPRSRGHEVNHLDSNRRNNRLTNLEYTTKKGNARHAVENGRYRRGSTQWKARLTEREVAQIKKRYVKGNGAALGREYGVDRATINHIVRGRTWTHA